MLPSWVLVVLGLVNAMTFVTYWRDKRAARARSWRTPESTLHLLALLGGWPSARLAQQVLRHKSSKQEFLLVYWACVVLHLAGTAAMVWHLAHQAR